ncbi:Crp/Fnr family transcriptional regulator [Aureibacter tunicatorum]|uniref:CRP-like cAMP-binding protein n=1 Tax=Aureibacter tunicatorum TaxID=866807 RepID=A0AAE4BQZ1_9BACT|nr:Crp/Fnr family transcriptional regulator [Aureibacter tunicatorum]MDR6238106.1 CRP-like cAMP-binding protein [Aureibacter tunicatorum]BDD03139.1 Crp/Fnr family transcriptional regulator [Aureibacter tunicatorum]
MSDSIWFFDNVNLYDVLCPHKLKEYQESHFKSYDKGEFVYFKEDASKMIYLVSKGKVRVVSYTPDGEEVVKSVLSKGEIFGEMALLGEQERKDFAVCASKNATICQLSVDDMHLMMRKNNTINLKIYKIIAFRVRKLERKLESMLFKDVRSRLMEFLKDLIEERGERRNSVCVITHPFTQKDIADLVGARRETVTSILNDLKDGGFLDYDRKSIIITQEGLERLGVRV